MSALSVKVDYVAALRSIKKLKEPDPIQAAVIAELAGADSITAHLREDRRYIRDRDVYILKELVKTRFTLQMAPTDDMMELALEVKPWRVTLMPSAGKGSVIENGIDLEKKSDLYAGAAGSLQNAGIDVCYFIDPEHEFIKAAARAKANAVELNSFAYATGKSAEESAAELELLEQAAQIASKLGMTVNCGGGLDYKNIPPLVDLDCFEEFTVGYAVTSRAVLVGYEFAVREMSELIH
jgi:pyridoxine 5-phosphate synthase